MRMALLIVSLRYLLQVVLVVAVIGSAHAQISVEDVVQNVSEEWAEVFYRLPEDQQVEKFKALMIRTREIQKQFPQRAEPLIMEAIILCTTAAAEAGIRSLFKVRDARELLIKSIDLDPRAMEGTAFITLGNLYYRLPGWPISYGDDDLARQYLEAGIKLFPDGLDANFFMGDFWLHQGDYDKALFYLERADKAPIRPHQRLSDSKLKEQLQEALRAARSRHQNHSDFFSGLLPASWRSQTPSTP